MLLLGCCAAAAQARECLVVALPGAAPSVHLGEKVEEASGMVMLRDASGAALGAWQASSVTGRLSLPAGTRESWTPDAIRKQVAATETFVSSHPAAGKALAPLLAEWKAYLEEIAAAEASRAAEAAEALRRRAGEFLDRKVDPAALPPLADIEALLQGVKDFEGALPDRVAEITAHAAAWQEVRDALAAGKVWVEGRWQTKEEVAAAAEAARQRERQQALEAVAPLSAPGAVLDAAAMDRLRLLVAVSFGSLLFSAAALGLGGTVSRLLRGKARRHEVVIHGSALGGLIHGLFVLVALGMAGVEAFYVYRLWFAPAGAQAIDAAPEGSPVILDMVYSVSGPPGQDPAGVPKEATFTDRALNGHLANHLRFEGADGGGLVRQAWGVRFLPGIIRLQENLAYAGRTWTATYDLEVQTDGGAILFTNGAVALDGLPLPKLLGGHLWNTFYADATKLLKASRILEHYTFDGLEGDTIRFRLSQIPATTAPPAPAPR